MAAIHQFSALGTHWWIELFDQLDEQQRAVIFNDCTLFITQFEAIYSRFKSDSFVSRLNTERVVHDCDDDIITLIRYSKELFSKSNGTFNVLTGDVLEKRGYNASYSFVESTDSGVAGNPITDLIIADTTVSLTAGRLDIGGFGKGYLIDLVAERLKTVHGCTEFLINGGGDLYVTTEHGAPITIHLEHPTEPGISIGSWQIKNQGFAASSPFKRRWKTTTGTTDHIVGTHDDVASYVIAATAGEADAFATTTLLLSETDCQTLATKNHLRLARFNPATNQLWQVNHLE